VVKIVIPNAVKLCLWVMTNKNLWEPFAAVIIWQLGVVQKKVWL